MTDRHILLTISDDASALQAVRFTCGFFRHTSTLKATLFYVAPNPKVGLSGAEIAKDYVTLNKREVAAKEVAQHALSRATEILMGKNFPQDNFDSKILFQQLGTANDIIQEGLAGMYDAIALGRRGLSRLEELLDKSVSKQIITTRLETPLWICRQQEKPEPSVLLCTDGSPASLRTADHVGFMLKDEPEHSITIAYIDTSGGCDNGSEAMAKTRHVLKENAIPSERIKELVVEGKNVSEVIITLARGGGYGVIATGRTGRGEAKSRQFWGSVSMSLLRHLDFATMWITH
ncbi:MAG: universal stress protein [Desulfomicrobium sp.]|nr:universal stress protein [Desulfomicrobium sp.]NLV95831.1 universal stress protein [Desulfovibrionales bacterium]